jgi:hypothetical protein
MNVYAWPQTSNHRAALHIKVLNRSKNVLQIKLNSQFYTILEYSYTTSVANTNKSGYNLNTRR